MVRPLGGQPATCQKQIQTLTRAPFADYYLKMTTKQCGSPALTLARVQNNPLRRRGGCDENRRTFYRHELYLIECQAPRGRCLGAAYRSFLSGDGPHPGTVLYEPHCIHARPP